MREDGGGRRDARASEGMRSADVTGRQRSGARGGDGDDSSNDSNGNHNNNNGGPEAGMRARLREEIEAPFRKARQFFYVAGLAGAAIAAFFSLTRLLALGLGGGGSGAASSSSGGELTDTFINLLINLGGGGVLYTLYRQDERAAARRLERLQSGAKLAALRFETEPNGAVRKLSSLRSRYRPVIVAGDSEHLERALQDATRLRDELMRRDIVVLPLLDNGGADLERLESAVQHARSASQGDGQQAWWLAKPMYLEEWRAWTASERARARNAEAAQRNDVVTFIVRRDGKVGFRGLGPPSWRRLFAEADKMPAAQRAGGE